MVTVRANAKINLTLDICSKRKDGYHLLDSVMQSVGCFDVVSVEKSNTVRVEQTAGVDGVNTAYTAAVNFLDYTQGGNGAVISIQKNIPVCAGLGGGSADAAAVIKALDRLYNTGLKTEEMCEIALSVGADVPFCIIGGTARVRGIGEYVEPIKSIGELYFVLVKEGEKGSTWEMYQKLDLQPQSHFDTPQAVEVIESGNIKKLCESVGNPFLSVCDKTKIIEDIKNTNPLFASLSGSGPTVFGAFGDALLASRAVQYLRECGYSPILTQAKNQGIEFV